MGARQTHGDKLAAEMLESLRTPQALLASAAAGVDSVEKVIAYVRDLLEENEGLAEEVLRGYEQLNLIFDFTRQIAHITDADEIVNVLLNRLATIFTADRVYLIEQSTRTRVFRDGRVANAAAEPQDAIRSTWADIIVRVRDSQALAVESVADAQALAGPLARLDGRFDVVLVLRPLDSRPFNAGDTMVLESVLTFAGQIIGNSELHERLRRMSMETARALVAAIDKKDHYTRGHSERVGLLARLTGRELGLSPAELQTLEWAGLLHDVGKIGVPEAILKKPGKLTLEEFAEIKKHPTMGFEILKPVNSLGHVLDGVLYHHENPDGTGYPAGLRGDEIPQFARIIHVVDVFDALTSARAYRPAFNIEQACNILRTDAGTKLDHSVTDAFLRVLDRIRNDEPEQLAAMYAGGFEEPAA